MLSSTIIAMIRKALWLNFKEKKREHVIPFCYMPFNIFPALFQLVTRGEHVGCDLENVLRMKEACCMLVLHGRSSV